MNEFDRQNDDLWKWGIIYVNPNDPAIWVEKRSGLGWTPNFAHPMAYIQLAMLLLTMLFIGLALS